MTGSRTVLFSSHRVQGGHWTGPHGQAMVSVSLNMSLDLCQGDPLPRLPLGMSRASIYGHSASLSAPVG